MTKHLNSFLKNRVALIFVAIIILAGILRFYNITGVPVSLYWDEVSTGYNAYSILESGRDEFGNKLPLLFRAFEDYKTPGNVYLTAVSIKLFGLNEFAVRFPSAILGTLTVIFTFFLTKELLVKSFQRKQLESLSLLTAFLLAISPWHINFSRTGFEANTGLFFVVLGAFLLFKYINSKLFKYLLLSMATLGISIYFYRSIWIFVPLLLTGIFVIYYKYFFSKENIKKSILGILLFLVVTLPFVPSMISGEASSRAGQVSVINNSNERVYDFAKKQLKIDNIFGKIIFNRRVAYSIEYLNGYKSHFYPKFLFFDGDQNLRHGRGFGVLYLWGILFIIPGIIALLKLKKKEKIIIIYWIIIAPIAAAFSVPTPHALRSLVMIPIPQLILALGIFWIYSKIIIDLKKIYLVIVFGIISIFLINYLYIYYGNYSRISSSAWGDGYKQLTQYVFENEKKYDKVVITGHYWQPYIYFLFYKKYDPELFQREGSKFGFDKYKFSGTRWDNEGIELDALDLAQFGGSRNILVALSPDEYKFQTKNMKVLKKIYNNNNELVFIVGEYVR